MADLSPRGPAEASLPLTLLTSFVGRERAVATLVELLTTGRMRLVTVTGPGGVGKTRLALHVADEAGRTFASETAFVPLAAVADPGLVAGTIAQALGARDPADRPPEERITAFFGDQRRLLVLDNFEQVVDAALTVAELLARCPRLTILVTSRVRLQIAGEQEYPLSPLGVPDTDPAAGLADSAPSVRLFVDRARQALPDFALTPANAAPVAAICRRLDGLPLAIELAAARVKILAPDALLARMDRSLGSLGVLTSGHRDLPPRQRTMREAIAWSYDLLDPDAQALFRLVSAFAGGFTLSAAEAINRQKAGGSRRNGSTADFRPPTAESVLDGLTTLVDASLVRQAGAGAHADGDDPRFGLLETVGEFGLEQLKLAGETERVRRAHAAWAVALAEEARPFAEGPAQAAWFDRLDADNDNLRLALAWSAEHDASALIRLAAALWRFWVVRGHVTEGRGWLERALAAGADAGSDAGIEVLYGASVFAGITDDNDRAVEIARALLAQAEGRGDAPTAGKAYNLLGNVDLKLGVTDRALAAYEAAYARLRSPEDDPYIAVVLDNLGTIASHQGRFDDAERWLGDALALWRRLGNGWGIGIALHDLGDMSLARGDEAAAAGYFVDCLRVAAAGRDRPGIAWALERAGLIAAGRGHLEPAVRFLSASEALARRLGVSYPDVPDQHGAAFAMLRSALGEPAFHSVWETGRAMPVDDVVGEAIATFEGNAAETLAPSVEPQWLTPRQIEVLRLLADGKTDREIAETLFISHRTAMTHVARILSKLNVSSRSAAVAYAFRQGLI